MHFAPPQSQPSDIYQMRQNKRAIYVKESIEKVRVSRVNEYVREADDFIKRRIHHARYAQTTVSISLKWRFGGHLLTLNISFHTRVKCFAPQIIPKRFPSPSLSNWLDIELLIDDQNGVMRNSHQTYFSWIKSWNAYKMAPLRASIRDEK